MLREALDWLTTPAAPGARRSGHLAEFVAIAARRRRHAAAWAPHLAETRRAVADFAADLDPAGTLVLLGAGHVDDLPVEDLAVRFRRVELVDLAFSAAARRIARSTGNVGLVERDVTGALARLSSALGPADVMAAADDLFRGDLAGVCSVNLLSQLAVVPMRRLEGLGMPEDRAEAVGAALIAAHLDLLEGLSCPALLVADRAVEILDRSSDVVATLDPTLGTALPEPERTWIWDIAPLGEVDRDHAVRHVVQAGPVRPAAD